MVATPQPDWNTVVYTAITFAPVQGFIEKSRKLRDLYGSSYLLSVLAQALCVAAEQRGLTVVSPASPNITQGMPNQIIIRGDFPESEARQSFQAVWSAIVETCRDWVKANVTGTWTYYWDRDWRLWANYTWELFWVQGEPGESITDVRNRLNEAKRSRGWTGINWQGESSTLSGADAVAWAELGKIGDPRTDHTATTRDAEGNTPVERFYAALSFKLGEAFIDSIPKLKAKPSSVKADLSKEFGAAFIDPDEELSIPELTKRLITHISVVQTLGDRLNHVPYSADLRHQIETDLNPDSFTDLNRLQHKNKKHSSQEPSKSYWTGWFQGDGDGASDYLKWLGQQGTQIEDEGTTRFSDRMRHWGREFKDNQSRYLPNDKSRVIYAGGDDFLGVLFHPNDQLSPKDCLRWFTQFKTQIWNGIDANNAPEKPITPSIGFVWASPKAPQREVLQHCRKAEKSAKFQGKDRIAFRILFSNGTHLEWACPWWILEAGLFDQYGDRSGGRGIDANWAHIYNDVAVLESRHAFGHYNPDNQAGTAARLSNKVAIALFKVYFGDDNDLLNPHNWWNEYGTYKNVVKAGLLGDPKRFDSDFDPSLSDVAERIEEINSSSAVIHALNQWVIHLAKVGFYLCSDT
jgi:CRISPR-associated protein Cmr2